MHELSPVAGEALDLERQAEYQLEPGRVYFAIVESVDAAEGTFVELDVVNALTGLLLDDPDDDWRTLAGIRATWRRAFKDPATADRVLIRLNAFGGGIARVRVDGPASRWSEWHSEGQWITVSLRAGGAIAAEPVDATTARRLSLMFGSDSFPSASAASIRGVLAGVPKLAQTVALDIGQGSANALLDRAGRARLYFDVGAGSRGNGKTRPASYHFCTCFDPPVVLSHWDEDHWNAARYNPELNALRWIVPRQLIGASHSRQVARILQAGGSVLVVKRTSLPSSALRGSRQELILRYGTGKSQKRVKADRNDCGLILAVRNIALDLYWLFPGDARYSKVPQFEGEPVVLMASHHGARLDPSSSPPSRCTQPYARLLYSFGPGNSYPHPHHSSITGHHAAGWSHNNTDAWGRDVRATWRPGQSGGTRQAVSGAWTRPAAAPDHLRRRHGLVSVVS